VKFINPRAKAIAHLDRVFAWQRGERQGPVTVEIDVSNACSLACQSCHFAHTHTAGPWAARDTAKPPSYSDTGKFASVSMLCSALGQMRRSGVEGIVWSGGGEPTLHPNFSELVWEAHGFGLQQGLYTLGGHINLRLQDTLTQCLQWVVVSLDAPDQETYAAEKGVPAVRFQDACEGVLKLAGGSAVVGVSFLLHAGNWSRTQDMLALSRSLGADYATFRPTVETSADAPAIPTGSRDWISWAQPALEKLAAEPDVEIDVARFHEYRDWSERGYSVCHGVKLLTQITPDGRVWVCPNRRGMAGSELGDLSKESFAAIWARHPGQWTDFSQCRAMCRLHLVNESLSGVLTPQPHEAFV
jgi:MoaA/NifB/PqqE/SkfB family radical SAM enzyme